MTETLRGTLFGAMFVLAAVLLAAPSPSLALGVDPPLADPKLEARAVDLHKQLRCLVCQNQSIHDSNAGLARDLREVVRERVTAGDTDDQVIAFFVDRYGDWVLLNPPFNLSTAALWGAPLALILGGGFSVALFLRRSSRKTAPISAPLSESERARLDRLLESDG